MIPDLPTPDAFGPRAPLAPPANPEALAVLSAIDRLEELLNQETDGLRVMSLEELKELNRRKSLCLLDLMRAARPLTEAAADDTLRGRVRALRDATARNAAVLQTHLEAVREIAGTVAQSIHERESDGTYSEAPTFRGAQR